MDEKLNSYRRRKQRQMMVETVKNSIKGISPWLGETSSEPLIAPKDADEAESIESEEKSDSVEEEAESLPDSSPNLTRATYFLYFVIWATLYVVAVNVEFGAVYFIISAFLLICLNTRTKPRKEGEISAYSVFNPNCEEIDGTLNAQQFEREIRYGSASV